MQIANMNNLHTNNFTRRETDTFIGKEKPPGLFQVHHLGANSLVNLPSLTGAFSQINFTKYHKKRKMQTGCFPIMFGANQLNIKGLQSFSSLPCHCC